MRLFICKPRFPDESEIFKVVQLYELHITPEISVNKIKLSVFPWHYDPKNQIEYLCTHCLRPVMAMDNGNRLLPNCFHHSFFSANICY